MATLPAIGTHSARSRRRRRLSTRPTAHVENLEPRIVLNAAQVTTYTTVEQFKLGTYTVDADFDKGVLFNLNHGDVADQLQLNARLSTFPVMWIANSGDPSVSKWDTTTNTEVARYFTHFAPAGQPGFNGPYGSHSGPAPSRTAVDRDGNVYIANRHFDGKPAEVIKILATGGIDRNGNGKIDTSADLDGDGNIGDSQFQYDAGEILPLADANGNGKIDPDEIQDERIAWVAQVGNPGGLGRSLAIDPDGNIWVGLYTTREYYKLDGQTGAIVAGPIATPGHSPYGAQIDGNGILWGASLSNNLLRLDTNTNDVKVFTHRGGNYGISIGNGKVYLASSTGDSFIQFDPATETFSYPAAEGFGALGVAVDRDGNIVVGKSNGGAAKFAPNGSVLWSVAAQPGAPNEVRGTVVDSNNDVWLIHLSAGRLSKHASADGAPLGVFETGNAPYTYTDATGLTRFTTTNPSGRWSVVQDSGVLGQPWDKIIWNTEAEGVTPEGTSIVVHARAADSREALEGLDFAPVQNGATAGLTGRFIEVRVTLNATSNLVSPVLSDITIAAEGAEPPISEVTPPQVVSFQRLGIHNQPTRLIVGFSDALDPAGVRRLGNYRIVCRGPDGLFGTRDDGVFRVRSAVYNPEAQTVTLRMRHPLSLRRTYQLTLNGSAANGLRGANGKYLDGVGDGTEGLNHVRTITRADLFHNAEGRRRMVLRARLRS